MRYRYAWHDAAANICTVWVQRAACLDGRGGAVHDGLVWSGLLGATMSFKSRTDAVLVDSMWPNSLRLIGNLLQFFAVLCFLLPVLYFCFFNWQGVWGQGYLGRASRLTADTLGFSMVWVSVAVPFATLIILLHAIARWCEPGRSTGINHQD